ncbi:MAG: putative protease YhbU precursor [Pelotomaculum sp. PtaU1.Bin035]|nr:MAG: putative protease YhbU precursor [Pelotomaculum sp. PtaU1.Bin035]
MPAKLELLAPAGVWEALVAAVENGADAVYLGGKLYSARESAGNFDNQELLRAIEFAHIRGVKIYVAVNTLLSDHELPGAARFLHFLQQAGADAAIIQDPGLIRLARRVVPELPLHASTQMTVHNIPAAQLLKEAGIKRVVLARELSLEAIREIVRQGGVEVEVFIHGALCVCYSGQCLLSSMIGGRSGNRGRCAQPCRLRYVLVDEKGRSLVGHKEVGDYLLSPRDLNMSRHLPDLIKAGITSLKIEGRMKRPEYVATVVRIYRELLDRATEGGEFSVTPEEAGELAQIFNRDFTTGYYYGRPGRELMSYKRPNNRGVRLGRIKGFDRNSRLAEVSLEKPLRVGDGIEVWVTEGGRAAGEVRRIVMGGKNIERAAAGDTVYLDIPGRVFPGDRVFKTHDADLVERARATFTSPKEQKKIPLVFEVFARINKPLKIKVTDPGGLTGEAETRSPVQAALTRPLNHDYLKNQLDRLGNTPFALAELYCELVGPVMAPVAEINEARRMALAGLEERRLAASRRKPVSEEDFHCRLSTALSYEKVIKKDNIEKTELAVAVTDLDSLKAAVKSGASMVYFGGEQYRSKVPCSINAIQAGGEICRKAGVRYILSSPRILQDQDLAWFSRLLEKIDESFLDGVQAGNLGLIKKVKEITGKPVYADFSMNVFNRETAVFLMEAGAVQVTLSPELTMEQIRRLIPLLPVPAEVIVHGAIPLMVSEYCAAGSLLGCGENRAGPCGGRHWGLMDRKGIVFPFELDQFCRMQLFNSRDLCVIEDVGLLAGTGAAALRIEARREDSGYVRSVVRAYRSVLNRLPETLEEDVTAWIKEALAKYSPDGFTRGHYYRGVL